MKKLILFFMLFLFLTGCSIQKIAIRTTSGLFSYGIEAIYAEPDMKLAEQAVASDLKLLEGLLRADPNNKKMLLMLTQGYASYALAFAEDEDTERASLFYIRAKGYGFRLLRRTRAFKDSIPDREALFIQRLKLIKKSEVPYLFWTAFAWAGWINLNRDNTQAVFDLNKVKAMMQRVLELDEGFFFGSAHLFFGSIYGSLPKMLGGDPQKAQQHFQRSWDLSKGKFLMAKLYLARYYAMPTLNEELFDQTIQEILQAPTHILPGYELLTSVAKKKAKILQSNKENWF